MLTKHFYRCNTCHRPIPLEEPVIIDTGPNYCGKGDCYPKHREEEEKRFGLEFGTLRFD